MRRLPSRSQRTSCWRRTRAAAALALGLCLALGACTEAGPVGPAGPATGTPAPTGPVAAPTGPALAWTHVDLPSRVEPSTVTALGDRLLVGAVVPGTPASPRMMTISADGTTSPIPLTPHSPYAPEATWESVVAENGQILAIGGARGGAHANVRWTVWSGTSARVEELPQDFNTFGGWGAGDLVDAVILPGGRALVGSWGGARAGLDAVVYTGSGATFTRTDPAGTALESTHQLLVGPRSATTSGSGILVVGSAVHLGQGAVSQQAALWRSTGASAGWHRIDLPDAGRTSEAAAARCVDLRCTVSGRVDGALAWWDVVGDRATRVAGVPTVPIADDAALPPPIVVRGATVQVVGLDGHVVVLTRTGSRWTRSDGPAGLPVAAALVSDRLSVIVSSGTRSQMSLWQSGVQALG